MDERREQLNERALGRGGVIGPDDPGAAGFGKNWRRRAEGRGELRRVQRNVYVAGTQAEDRWIDIAAAWLRAGPDSAISHGTAAELLGIPHVPRVLREGVHVTVVRGTRPRVERVHLHQLKTLPKHHLTVVDHVRVTNVPRTLSDLAGVVKDPTTLARIVDGALAEELTTPDEVRAVLDDVGSVRGCRRLRTHVDRFDTGMIGTRSDKERTFFRLLQSAGLPLPRANVEIIDANGERRYLDFAYVPERIPIEIDSERFHGSTLARTLDGRRQNAIVLTGGWRAPLRFHEDDLTERPGAVVADVRRALAAVRAR